MATALTRVILDRDPELRDTWTNLTPMGRIGEPEDLKGKSASYSGAHLRSEACLNSEG